MASYPIITVPDPVLKQDAKTIERIDDTVKKQAEMMLESMRIARGIGLAANQVGMLNRIFVMDLDPESWIFEEPGPDGVKRIKSGYKSGAKEEDVEPASFEKVLINPEIVWSSEEKSVFEEGCLSIPQQYADVTRPAKVVVKYQTLEGETVEEEAEGLNAHCVQHEIDHLNGKLFIDYLSSLKRDMMVRRVKRLVRQDVL